jgi:hypothetical protein
MFGVRVAACAALFVASAAPAATVTFALTGSTATSGTHGNVRQFTASNGSQTVNVRASAWNMTSTRTYDSYLGAYSNGLGVTSDGESSGSPDHTMDNKGRKDFVLFQFDQKVSLVSGKFTTYTIDGAKDSDATIGWNNSSLAWTIKPSLNDKLLSTLNALIPVTNRLTSTGNGTGGLRTITNGQTFANVWLVGADFNRSSSSPYDGFKFSTMTVAVIPEPGTWAMMIGGFSFIGAAARRRRTAALA